MFTQTFWQNLNLESIPTPDQNYDNIFECDWLSPAWFEDYVQEKIKCFW